MNFYRGAKNTRAVRQLWFNKWKSVGIEDVKTSFEEICKFLTKRGIENNFQGVFMPELHRLCYQRYLRTPLQYIIGEWDFRELTIKMRKPIFIPRPETEQLAGLVIDHVKNNAPTESTLNVLEIGCGTGAISLAIAHETECAKVTAIDVNPEACSLAIENCSLLNLNSRVNIHHAELNEKGRIEAINFDTQFEVIVSNPPYISVQEMTRLQPEVALFEDERALNGGVDGLQIVDRIITFAKNNLTNNGNLFLEVGLSHPTILKERFASNHYGNSLKVISSYPDFTNRDRFLQIARRIE